MQSLDTSNEMTQVHSNLCSDLQRIGLLPIKPILGRNEVIIVLRPYSKTYFGRFVPKSNKIFIYVYKDIDMSCRYSYTKLLCTAIHEAVHAKQHNDVSFVRVLGIMHNEEFFRLYKYYINKAKSLGILKEEVAYE